MSFEVPDYPRRAPEHEEAWHANDWRVHLIHVLQDTDALIAASKTLDDHDDKQWGIKLLCLPVASLRHELIAECEAAIAAYQAQYGAAEEEHQRQCAAWKKQYDLRRDTSSL